MKDLRSILSSGCSTYLSNSILHYFALLFFLIFSNFSLKATDLSVDLIPQPPTEGVYIHGIYPVKFVITNNLYLDADKFTVTVSISNALQGIVWTVKDTFGLLEKYTSATFSSKYAWQPDTTGEHIIFVRVDYSQDINRSNDTLRKYVTVNKIPESVTKLISLVNLPSHNNTKIVETLLHFLPFSIPSWGYYNLFIKKTSQSSPEWIIKNLLIPKITTDYWVTDWNSNAVNLPDDNDTLRIREFKTKTPMLNMPEWDDSETYRFQFKHVTRDLSNGEISINLPTELTFDEQIVTQVDQQPKDTVYRADMPNIDLISKEHPGSVNGYAGDKNSCAPASCANSMEWLELRNPKITSNLSHREKLEELSKFMEREKEGGSQGSNTIVGKLRYINAHRLPIHVKFWARGIGGDVESGDDIEQKATNMGDSVKGVSWDFLKHEMQNNEDVEASLSFWEITDRGWVLLGKHAVVISGVGEGGGNKQIWFRDDSVQKESGGIREVSAQWKIASGPNSIPYISYTVGDSGKKYLTTVERIYSESYDSTITFKEKGIMDLIFEGSGRYFREQDRGRTETGEFEIRVANALAKHKEGDTSQWIVKNMPYSIDGVNQFETYFNAEQIGYVNSSEKKINPNILAANDSILVKIFYSDSIWHTAKQITDDEYFWYKFNKSSITKLPEGSIDNDNFKINDVYRPFSPTFTGNKVNFSDSSHSALEMKIIDLDNSSNPSTTTPPYSGDVAASAPATVANVLEWLESINPNLKTNLNTRNKLITLSYLMNREAGKGAMRDNFIKGVLNFIDTLKVPLRVKFQSFRTNSNDISSPISVYMHNAKNETSANGKPDWSWIKREIKANGTVAVELGWYDSTGRISGTWCNIAGYFEQNGTKKLLIKDDCKQDSAGGIRKALLSYDTSSSGYPMIVEHSTSKKQCYIESIVSMSYDPTIVFTGIGEDYSGVVTNLNIYPNPSSVEQSMIIEFFSPENGNIEISVFDMLGNKIQNVQQTYMDYGQHKINLSGKYDNGNQLLPGVYLIVLKGEKFRAATKLIKY